MGYGIVSKQQAVEFSKAVCDVIGHGSKNNAVNMLVETAAAETLLGDYVDPTVYAAGTGITQVDYGTFVWLQKKYWASRHGQKIKQVFNIHLERVAYNELETSPLLAFIFCRLRYYTVPDPIPESLNDRAFYWKEFYNTSAGKGSATEYIVRCEIAEVDRLRFS